MNPDKRICLGVIIGAHGIKGWMKLRSHTGEPAGILDYARQLTDAEGKPMPILSKGRMHEHLLIALPAVTDRNQAEAMRGVELFVPREILPDPAEDEFLIEDLIGMEVHLQDGMKFGDVTAIFDFGAGDIVEILTPEGKRELYGFTQANFPVIDGERRRLIFDPPETLTARSEPA